MRTKLIVEDFLDSGLIYAELEARGIVQAVSAEELTAVLPKGAAPTTNGGVAFQYYAFDPEAEFGVVECTHKRYKVYWPPLTGFAAKTKDSRPKYLQAAGTPNRLYIPPVVDWNAILEDPTQVIAITEGEKKTLALNLRGMPTVGIGGVYSSGNKKRGQLVLPELRDLCGGDRSILIVFDIDAGYTTMKPEVARAAIVLANQLLELGGKPRIVTLPSEGSKKCAVDDWLKTHELSGFPLYAELSRHAKPLDTATALYEEAEKYVYIADSNALANIRTREAVMVADYRISSGNRQVVVQELVTRRQKGGGIEVGTEIAVRPLGEAFLRWGSRPTAKSTTYEPGNTHYLTESREFNQWKGWAQPVPEAVTETDVAPLWAAFQAFYGADAEWMWNWFMYPIARPGAKWVMIPVIQAEEEGIGKSSIPMFFAKFVYGEGYGTPNNATTLNAMSLKDGRLEFMAKKQFLFLDDANDLHGSDIEALVKNLSTSDSIRVNPKYLRSYECRNYANLCITTNRTLPFRLSDMDRRLGYPFCATTVPPSVWHELHKWGREQNGGGKVVAYAQQLFDADAVDPNMRAPMTEKKESMIQVARSPFEDFVVGLKVQAEDGNLARVVFTGRELRILAEMEGVVRSAHDVGPMTLNRAVKLAKGAVLGRAKTLTDMPTFYAFAQVARWKEAQPQEWVKEQTDVPIDRVRLPRRSTKGGVIALKEKKY